jgi:hypothetical protein
MFDLVRTRSADLEEARNTATMALRLAQVAIYPAEPLLKSCRLRQRIIALVWLVVKGKPGIKAFGQDGCIRLGKAAATYACLQNEKRCFCNLMTAPDGPNVLSSVPSSRRTAIRPPEYWRRAGLGFQSDPGSIGRTDDADGAEL